MRYQRFSLRLSFYKEIKLQGKTPILVYQMARVGSQSVYHSLRANSLSQSYHLHVFSAENLYLIYPRTLRTARLQAVFHHFQREATILGPLLGRHMQRGGRVKVITPIRDPIARNVSLFFHMLWVAGVSFEHVPLEELTELFLTDMRHDIALRWFDLEVQPSLGIDVYQHPFPQELGYVTIIEPHADILIYQAELADGVKERILAEFLALDQFRLLQRNNADRTPYAMKYRQFLKDVCLAAEYVEEMCQSRYVRHFYSETERDRMRRKWLHV